MAWLSICCPMVLHLLVADISMQSMQSVKNTEDSRSLQNDINKLEEWAKIWQIRFNATKCKVMHLGKENMHLCLCGQGSKFQTSYTTRDCQRKQVPWINKKEYEIPK